MAVDDEMARLYRIQLDWTAPVVVNADPRHYRGTATAVFYSTVPYTVYCAVVVPSELMSESPLWLSGLFSASSVQGIDNIVTMSYSLLEKC